MKTVKKYGCSRTSKKVRNVPCVIGLDTSGAEIKIALRRPDGKTRGISRREINQENHLFPMLDKLLRHSGSGSIGRICVISGPGRFTGIRVGLTFASVMSEMSEVKAEGISALEVLAWQAAVSEDFRDSGCGVIGSVMHAFKNEYYFQPFKPVKPPVFIRPLSKAVWVTGEELKKTVKKYGKGIYCIGLAEKEQPLSDILFPGTRIAGADMCSMEPESIISACVLRPARKNKELVPIYLKPARFQIKARK